jgi:hypothetical protein
MLLDAEVRFYLVIVSQVRMHVSVSCLLKPLLVALLTDQSLN